ncbi:hypothetical protein WAI453_003550 [Rhynchosporium graminicola]
MKKARTFREDKIPECRSIPILNHFLNPSVLSSISLEPIIRQSKKHACMHAFLTGLPKLTSLIRIRGETRRKKVFQYIRRGYARTTLFSLPERRKCNFYTFK